LYSNENDKHESSIYGYIVDILHNNTIIEIQTGSFSKMKAKLSALLLHYKVKLVHPIAFEKTLVVHDSKKKNILYRRRSPKKGQLIDIVDEIIYIPQFLTHPNFSLEVLLTKEEEIRSSDGKGSWRRRGVSILDRKLLDIIGRFQFNSVKDYQLLLPDNSPSSFTNRKLSDIMHKPVRKVQKLTYCLKQIGLLQVIDKKGNAYVYEIINT